MHIKIDKEKIDGNYHLIFKEEPTTEVEKAEFDSAVAKHGKLIVDFGGEFLGEASKTVIDPETNVSTTVTNEVALFKFNENLKEIPTSLPFTRIFKKSQYGENAEKFATVYGDTMSERIDSVFKALKEEEDKFSSPDIDIHY